MASKLNMGNKDVTDALQFAAGNEGAAAAVLLQFAQAQSKDDNAKKKAAAAREARAQRLARESVPVEDRIVKAAEQLTACPPALDVLLLSLRKAIADPTMKRTRKIDVNDQVYRKTVADASGGRDLLYACGYRPDGKLTEPGSLGYLVLEHFDASVLARAIQVLEQAQSSEAYLRAAAQRKEEHDAARARIAAEESARVQRAAHRAKVPHEPEAGGTVYGTSSVSQIDVHISGEEKVSRRFESQDTLAHLEHFIRSLAMCPGDDPEVDLLIEDVTTSPPRSLDLDIEGGETLYALGLWPLAHVRVRTLAAAEAAKAAERRASAKDGWVIL